MALGKYALNLIGCSKDVAKEVYQMVEFLVTKVYNISEKFKFFAFSRNLSLQDFCWNFVQIFRFAVFSSSVVSFQ